MGSAELHRHKHIRGMKAAQVFPRLLPVPCCSGGVSLAPDFPLSLAKVDAGSYGKSHAAAWRHLFDLPIGQRTRPGFERQILQAPNPSICRVARHQCDGLSKVIEPLRIDVVGKELRIKIKRDHLFANLQMQEA